MKYFVSSTARAAMLALLLASSTGCDLLSQQSPQDFNPDDVFASPTRIEKAALGMYDGLQDGEFLGSFALIYSDVRSDDVDLPAGYQVLATSTLQASDANALNAWAGGYRSMYMANYMIRELTKRNGAGISVEKYDQYIAEAKFIRALCHFTLVNLFAHPYNYKPNGEHPGIPIQLEAPDGTEAYLPAQQKARSSVKEVYDRVIQDLTEAIPKLPDSYGAGNDNVSRATKDAARGLLSRVYLYKSDFSNAAAVADQVIRPGQHQLNSKASDAFRVQSGEERSFGNDTESIFFIAMSQNDNPNTNAAIGQFYAPGTSISAGPLAKAIPGPLNSAGLATTAGSTTANTDLRRLELLTFRTAKWWTRKYTADLATGTPVSNRGAWIPIVRYPEILLTRAEALARTNGVTPEAVRLVNLVRNRSKPTTADTLSASNFTNTQDFVNAVLTERRFELAFEGHRLYDLFRNGMDVPAHGTGTVIVPRLGWTEDRSIFPIPANEIQRNPNLRQNDGY